MTQKNSERLKSFLLYTGLYCLFVVGIFAVLILSHRSVMQFHDAYRQGAYRLVELHNQMTSILSGDGFHFWSWYEGTGLDEPLENFVDPGSIIGSIFPARYIELGFTAAALIRMYLGGLAFMLLGLETGLDKRQRLLGAILYTFSACFIGLAIRQSEHLVNAYLFPLLIAGAERIYKGKRPTLFILTVAFYMIVSVYFAYMAAIAVIMYILLRYFAYNDRFNARDYLVSAGRFILYGIIGIMISAVGSLFAVTTITRASTESSDGVYGLLFGSDWYTTFGKMLLGTGATYDYSDIGPSILVLLLIPLALRKLGRRATNAIMTVILTLMMLIPFCSSMFNGFGYATPRWSFTLLLFMVWTGMEQLDAERLKEKGSIALACAGLAVMAVWTFGLYTAGVIDISRTGRVYVPLQLAAGAVLILLLAVIRKQGRISRPVTIALFAVPLISLSLGWAVGFNNNIENFARNSSVYNNLYKSALRAGAQIDDEGFYRIDSVDGISRHAEIKFPSNENIWWKTNNLFIYNSRIPQKLTEFNVELGNSYGYARRVYVLSNGNRMGLDFLFGVRYFLGNDFKDLNHEDSDNYAGYGFERAGEIDGVDVFRNKYDASLGFVADKVMLRSDFDRLTRAQKEQVLMQAAVIEDEEAAELSGGEARTDAGINTDVEEVPFEIIGTDGLRLEDGRIIADKKNASVTIAVHDLPDCQLMVSFDNIIRKTGSGPDGGSYEISVSDGNVVKTAIKQSSRQGVSGIRNHDLSLGHASGDKEIRIVFSAEGTYDCDRMYVSAMSTEKYDSFAEKCIAGSYRVTSWDDSRVEGTVDAGGSGVLVLAMPEHANWDVYVDGSKADKIDNTDICLLGVRLDAGTHDVTLRYNNRYVKFGGLISVMGLLILAAITVRSRRAGKDGGTNE